MLVNARLTLEEFDYPDDKNPRYSQAEYDFYGHLPAKWIEQGEGNHRLSLRKDLTTGKYQIYAHYWRTIRHGESEEIFFEDADIQKVFKYGNTVAVKKWGGDFDAKLEIIPFDFGIKKPEIRHGVVGVKP